MEPKRKKLIVIQSLIVAASLAAGAAAMHFLSRGGAGDADKPPADPPGPIMAALDPGPLPPTASRPATMPREVLVSSPARMGLADVVWPPAKGLVTTQPAAPLTIRPVRGALPDVYQPDIPLPDRKPMAVLPLINAAGPDPAGRITPAISPRAADRLIAGSDPTIVAARAIELAAASALHSTAAAFIKLVIPDPFENLAALKLRATPPDNDAPVAPISRPLPVKLPE